MIIIRFNHIRTLHSGKRFTKAQVFDQYFISKLDSKAFEVISKCIECQRKRKTLTNQPIGPLPLFRTKEYNPFECIGIDCFGRLTLKDKIKKYYGLISVFSVSRAIVKLLKTHQHLQAFLLSITF